MATPIHVNHLQAKKIWDTSNVLMEVELMIAVMCFFSSMSVFLFWMNRALLLRLFQNTKIKKPVI